MNIIYILVGLVFGYILRSLGIGAAKSKNDAYSVGNIGEAQVRHFLTNYCAHIGGHLLNNITLRLEDGSTTQIDHILLTTKGIFVIETKHYSGWIFGNTQSKIWMQSLYHLKNRFQNPIFQNYKHVKAIRRLFDFLDPKFVHNIVVFTGDAEFKTPKPDNVFYIDELISAIKQYPNNVLSLNRVQFCVGRLEYVRLELTQKTDIEHQAYLAQRFGD